MLLFFLSFFFFFNDTATTEIYTLSLHDALPIYPAGLGQLHLNEVSIGLSNISYGNTSTLFGKDRKSTRLNSSHSQISYAVFCLKKKKKNNNNLDTLCLNYLLIIVALVRCLLIYY